MFDTLKSKIYQGKQYIKDIKNAEIKRQFRGFPDLENDLSSYDINGLKTICPTDAIGFEPLSIDMGKCTFCGKCAKKGIKFTNKHKLGTSKRDKLIITADIKYEDYIKNVFTAKDEIVKLFGRSLKLRQVSAGGCNGCEMELNACSNVNFDMGRFGIDFVASPRHADGLVITGPITKNMAEALEDCYNSTPDPKILILCGACAISGGIFKDSEELNREFLSKHEVDLYIPGCPVHPLTFINALLMYLKRN